jgi:RNA polymerase sigma factor (sigma-70 family)
VPGGAVAGSRDDPALLAANLPVGLRRLLVTDADVWVKDREHTVSEPGQAALVSAARRGDKAALATLVVGHRPMLVAVCRDALGDVELAEDAAQEAVLLALMSLDRLRQADRFGPWVAGIGLNVCRRCLRERSRVSWSWEAVAGGRADGWPVPGPGPAELAEAAEDTRLVRAAVAGLPAGQRVAVTLHYLAGLTQAETAAQAGTSVGAVKVRLHKARVRLRERLGPWWREERMAVEEATGWVQMRVTDVRRGPPAVTCRSGTWWCWRRWVEPAACLSGSARSRGPRWR